MPTVNNTEKYNSKQLLSGEERAKFIVFLRKPILCNGVRNFVQYVLTSAVVICKAIYFIDKLHGFNLWSFFVKQNAFIEMAFLGFPLYSFVFSIQLNFNRRIIYFIEKAIHHLEKLLYAHVSVSDSRNQVHKF